MAVLDFLKLLWGFKWPILVLTALIFGFFQGKGYEEGNFEAKHNAELKQRLEQQNRDILRSMERSLALNAAHQGDAGRIDAIKPQVRQSLTEKKVRNEEVNRGLGSLELPDRTIRLLNDARADLSGDSDGGSGTAPAAEGKSNHR